MPRLIPDGVLKVLVVPTIADPAAPSLATDLAGAIDITAFVTKSGGLTTPTSYNLSDNGDMSTTFNAMGAGTVGGDALVASLYRDQDLGGAGSADLAWDALPELFAGYLVVAQFGGSGAGGALAATDVVEVYPIEVASRRMDSSQTNTRRTFTAACAVRSAPEIEAVVAA